MKEHACSVYMSSVDAAIAAIDRTVDSANLSRIELRKSIYPAPSVERVIPCEVEAVRAMLGINLSATSDYDRMSMLSHLGDVPMIPVAILCLYFSVATRECFIPPMQITAWLNDIDDVAQRKLKSRLLDSRLIKREVKFHPRYSPVTEKVQIPPLAGLFSGIIASNAWIVAMDDYVFKDLPGTPGKVIGEAMQKGLMPVEWKGTWSSGIAVCCSLSGE